MTGSSVRNEGHEDIVNLVALYIDGARTGQSKSMRSAFLQDAVMSGLLGPDKHVTPIESLFSWVDSSPASPGITATIKSIYVSGTLAIATVDIDDWAASRYEDVFVALKTDHGWKISSKTYRSR